MANGAGGSSQQESDPHFFRTVGHQTLEAETLEIPEAFVVKYGSYLSKYACLEINTGKLWKVELERCDGRIWLHKGWKEFVDSCNIKSGYSLAFRYEGGSFFHVFAFDSTRLEIDYSAGTNQPKLIGVKEEDVRHDSSLEILHDWPQNSNQVSLPNQPIIGNNLGDDEVHQGEGPSLPPSARDGVVQRAPHPSFTFVMGPTYHTSLCIPENAAISYFHGRGDNSVYLNGPDGKAWLMNYAVGGPPLYDVNIISEWSKFVEEYQIQDGDTCIFELMDSSVIVFNVTVEFAVEIVLTALERAKCMQCSNPSFVASIKNIYHLSIPACHASRHLADEHEKEVFLELDGKTWSVKYYLYCNSFARFSAGWRNFVRENDLHKEDACVFELFSQAPNRYNVTIFRDTEATERNR